MNIEDVRELLRQTTLRAVTNGDYMLATSCMRRLARLDEIEDNARRLKDEVSKLGTLGAPDAQYEECLAMAGRLVHLRPIQAMDLRPATHTLCGRPASPGSTGGYDGEPCPACPTLKPNPALSIHAADDTTED